MTAVDEVTWDGSERSRSGDHTDRPHWPAPGQTAGRPARDRVEKCFGMGLKQGVAWRRFQFSFTQRSRPLAPPASLCRCMLFASFSSNPCFCCAPCSRACFIYRFLSPCLDEVKAGRVWEREEQNGIGRCCVITSRELLSRLSGGWPGGEVWRESVGWSMRKLVVSSRSSWRMSFVMPWLILSMPGGRLWQLWMLCMRSRGRAVLCMVLVAKRA